MDSSCLWTLRCCVNWAIRVVSTATWISVEPVSFSCVRYSLIRASFSAVSNRFSWGPYFVQRSCLKADCSMASQRLAMKCDPRFPT